MKPATHREPIKERIVKRRLTNGSNAGNARSPKDAYPSKGGLIPSDWQRKVGRAGSIVESFYHAFHGIKVGLAEQRNLRIHFFAAPLVILLGVVLNINVVSWLALVFAMGLVISTEFLNTAIEHLVDVSAEGQYQYSARCAKDTAAAAVLTASVVAIVIGLIIFLPKLIAFIS